MSTTPYLGLPLVVSGQSQPEVTHNEAIFLIQAFMNGVKEVGRNTPPASPAAGDSYIVGESPTGDWVNRENTIAIWFETYWLFMPGNDDNGTPITMGVNQEGLRVWSQPDNVTYVWTDLGASPGLLSWQTLPSELTQLDQLDDVNSTMSPVQWDKLTFDGGQWSNVNDNIVIVRSDDDLPTPSGGVITLENKEYRFVNSYSSANSLGFPGSGNRATLRSVNGATRTYTGTDAHFSDQAAGGNIECVGQIEFHAPNGMMWSLSTTGSPPDSASFQAQVSVRFRNCKVLGWVVGMDFNIDFGSVTDFYDGIHAVDVGFFELNEVFLFGSNSAKLNYDGQTSDFTLGDTVTGGTSGATGVIQWDYDSGGNGTLVLSNVSGTFQDDEAITDTSGGAAVVDGTLFNVRFVDVSGPDTTGPVNMTLLSTETGPNEAIFYFDPEVETANLDGILLDRIQQFEAAQGVVFDTGSLTQEDIKVKAVGSQIIPDSTVKASISISDNTSTTTISAVDTPTAINALWNEIDVPELLEFQDNCTFTGSTDTITTTFNHGLTSGDQIEFVEDGGLPTGLLEDTTYYVINETATTFQVSLTEGGSAVDFTGNGTAPNYYRHTDGVSSTGWVIYTGLVDVALAIEGWVTMTKSGTTRKAGLVIMKTDVSFTETVAFRGSTATVSAGESQSSVSSGIVSLCTDEGFKVFIENRENDADLIVEDARLTPRRI